MKTMVLVSQNKNDVVILGPGSHLWSQGGRICVAKTAGSIMIGNFSSEEEGKRQMLLIAEAFADEKTSIYYVPA